jgi:hypothetical protein
MFGLLGAMTRVPRRGTGFQVVHHWLLLILKVAIPQTQGQVLELPIATMLLPTGHPFRKAI